MQKKIREPWDQAWRMRLAKSSLKAIGRKVGCNADDVTALLQEAIRRLKAHADAHETRSTAESDESMTKAIGVLMPKVDAGDIKGIDLVLSFLDLRLRCAKSTPRHTATITMGEWWAKTLVPSQN